MSNQVKYLEQYRHKNDPVTKADYAFHYSAESFTAGLEKSKLYNMITVAYFRIKLKVKQ